MLSCYYIAFEASNFPDDDCLDALHRAPLDGYWYQCSKIDELFKDQSRYVLEGVPGW